MTSSKMKTNKPQVTEVRLFHGTFV